MPEICRFRGIIISINWNDHNPPHFRATYSDYEVSVDILNLEVRDGKISKFTTKNAFGLGISSDRITRKLGIS